MNVHRRAGNECTARSIRYKGWASATGRVITAVDITGNTNIVVDGVQCDYAGSGIVLGPRTGSVISNIVTRANAIWSPNMISIEHESTVVVNDLPQYFEIPQGYWTAVTRHRRFDRLDAGANVVLVNRINANAEGKAISHLVTDMVAFEASGSGTVLAHELGHFFGLVHRNRQQGNLMQHSISDIDLTQREIEEAHENFARFSGLKNSVRTE